MSMASTFNITTDLNMTITGFKEPYNLTISIPQQDYYEAVPTDEWVIDMKIYDQLLGFQSEQLYLNFTSKLNFASAATTLTLSNDTIFTQI